jgi:hypothetical protein
MVALLCADLCRTPSDPLRNLILLLSDGQGCCKMISADRGQRCSLKRALLSFLAFGG